MWWRWFGVWKRGVRDVAKRALETTGQIFRYAIAHGHTTRNPAAEIKPRDVLKATVRENYVRVDAKDLPALLQQIEVYSGTHLTRLAIKLMALTFVRTGELIGARWSEIDLVQRRWNIPADRMKMRTPHIQRAHFPIEHGIFLRVRRSPFDEVGRLLL